MKTLTIKDIRQYKHLQKRQTTTVQKNSGLSLIVENERNQCKRFEGLIRHNKKLIHVPLGVFGNDIKTSKDLNNLLKTWDDIKDWVKTTGNYPKDYFKKDFCKGLIQTEKGPLLKPVLQSRPWIKEISELIFVCIESKLSMDKCRFVFGKKKQKCW